MRRVALLLLVTGCAATATAPAVQTGPRYSDEGLRIDASDFDGDGTLDLIKYFVREEDPRSGDIVERLVRTEMDLDDDGSINLRRSYDDEGELALEEMDGNFDGRVDHTVYWDAGQIARSEQDRDLDGNPDVFRSYSDGFLSQVLRDTDDNGEVDEWAYYDRSGLVRIGRDTDGDGEADRWTRRTD